MLAIALFVAGLGAGFWWFGLMLLALYGCLLPMGLAMAGMVVGVALLERIRQPFTPVAAPVVAGIVLLAVLGQVPAIGALVNVLALIYGLGALMLAPRQRTTACPSIARRASARRDHRGARLGAERGRHARRHDRSSHARRRAGPHAAVLLGAAVRIQR